MAGTEIVEFVTEDGSFFAEVELAYGNISTSDRLRAEWDDLKAQIAGVSANVLGAVRNALPEEPARCEVEFGLKLTAETGSVLGVLAKAGGEASIVVRFSWDKPAT